MAIVIEPYQQVHEVAVDDFNRRLQSGGAEENLVFYRWAKPRFLPHSPGAKIYNEYFLALENNVVRGGYALKHQEFKLPDGSTQSLGYYHHPLSEGIVNKAHAVVGSLLLRHALQRSPLLYCLGMGGYDRPLPRMLVSLGWTHCLVPFYFRVLKPARFLQQMQAIRTSPWRRGIMDAAAISGAGWAALQVWNTWTRLRSPGVAGTIHAEIVPEFSSWVDPLWNQAKDSCSMTAIRDSHTLGLLYPASDSHFTRLRVMRGGQDIGWAVVGEKRKDPKYGSLRVASILDGWALPSAQLAVVQAATDASHSQGFDLIVSNQSHHSWCAALESAGFFAAQSNFIFAASKKLAAILQPFEQVRPTLHFTRADGDGLPRNF